jgi:hypothetical protein
MPNGREHHTSVGFHLWNMGKRLDGVRADARRAMAQIDGALEVPSLDPSERHKLIGLHDRFERCVALAQQTWARLAETTALSDPDRLETEDGVTIIRNHAGDPSLMADLWGIWHDDQSLTESAAALAELADLMDRKEDGA